MAKLCAKGKAAAKRKFKVYPSAYANMYAGAVCSGKVTPGGKKNAKNKKISKMAVGGGANSASNLSQSRKMVSDKNRPGMARGCGAVLENRRKTTKYA